MRARSFFYISLGVLALTFAFHLGARTAVAQSSGFNVVGISSYYLSNCGNVTEVVTVNGDVYRSCGGAWQFVGNAFSGGPAPARQESMGSVKARYR